MCGCDSRWGDGLPWLLVGTLAGRQRQPLPRQLPWVSRGPLGRSPGQGVALRQPPFLRGSWAAAAGPLSALPQTSAVSVPLVP